MFLQVLADYRIHCLQNLTLADESAWFKNRDGCMQSLIVLLARQTNLKLLYLGYNWHTEEQKQQIREAVANPDCRLVLTNEEFGSY